LNKITSVVPLANKSRFLEDKNAQDYKNDTSKIVFVPRHSDELKNDAQKVHDIFSSDDHF